MALQPVRELKVGAIIDRTVGVVEKSMTPALIFIAVFSVLGAIADYVTLENQGLGGLLTLVFAVVGIVGGYLLLEAMLKSVGLFAAQGERRYLPYVGLSILMGLGIGVGFVLLIIPGLVIMSRWSVAQVLFIGDGERVMDALGKSWELTKGNEVPIIGATLAMVLLFIAVIIGAAFLFEPGNILAIVISQIASNAASVVIAAMGVGIYSMIGGARQVAQAFD